MNYCLCQRPIPIAVKESPGEVGQKLEKQEQALKNIITENGFYVRKIP
jgi:hypothetical protein